MKKIFKNNYAIVIFGCILMISCYWNAFGQELYNIDSINRIYSIDYQGAYISQGRLWREIFDSLLGVSMLPPLPTIIISCFAQLIMSFSLIKILQAKKTISKYLIVGMVISFPLIGYYYLYGTDLIYYSFSLMFATLSVEYCINKKYIISGAFLILGLFGYQMILSYVTILLLYLMLEDLLESRIKLSDHIVRIVTMMISALIYFILWKLIIHFSIFEITAYRGASSLGIKSLFTDLVPKIATTYYYYFHLITGNFPYFNTNIIIKLISIFSFMIILLSPLFTKSTKNNRFYITFAVVLLLIPIFTFATMFIIDDIIPRAEMGLIIYFIFPTIKLAENKQTSNIGFILGIILIIYGMFFINSTLLVSQENVKQETELTTGIYNDLVNFDTFDSSSEVNFCGSFMLNNENLVDNTYPFITDDNLLQSGPTIVFNTKEIEQNYEYNLYSKRLNGIFKRNGYNINVAMDNCEYKVGQTYYPDVGYISESNNKFTVYLGPKDIERKFNYYF